MSTVEKIKALHQLSEGINPTIIYNEGWMIRLLVEESKRTGLTVRNLDFSKVNNWTSEAQISSPFEGAELKKHKKNETKTHTDIILGDFLTKYGKSTEIEIKTSVKVLGIIEAKMGSNLSTGIKNATEYNQASRSICCLAHMTIESPECEIFFVIVAPETKIEKSKFEKQIGAVKDEIKNRFKEIGKEIERFSKEYTDEIEKKVENCKKTIISYEDWINEIKDNDVKSELNKFYDKCKKYNKIEV